MSAGHADPPVICPACVAEVLGAGGAAPLRVIWCYCPHAGGASLHVSFKDGRATHFSLFGPEDRETYEARSKAESDYLTLLESKRPADERDN